VIKIKFPISLKNNKRRDYKMSRTLNSRIFLFITMLAVFLLSFNGVTAARIETKTYESQEERGWCCHEGKVFPAAPEECRERGGHFSPTREEAEEHCREKPHETGWCCHDGKVFPAAPEECRERGGQFFPTREEAEEHCREKPHESGWCCHDGKVFPASPEECRERGGHFFPTREEAEEHCREKPHESGWCCHEGKVFPAAPEECRERRGQFFHTREEAEEHCREKHPEPGPGILRIPDLKRPGWEKYVGKTVTIEGIFVRDPIPMLVTDIKIVLANMPMPKDQYILLTGNQAKEIDNKQFGGAKLRITGEVKAVDDANVKNLGDYVVINVFTFKFIKQIYKYHPERIPIELITESRDPLKYAILFSGGVNKSNNHIRYWNDLKFMYSALINKNKFSKNNIAVLYADGKGLDKQIPVHYSATQTNLETVFNLLRKDATGKDFVFIFATNHGGGFCNAGYQYWGTTYYKLGGRFDANADEGPADNIVEKSYNMDLNSDGDKNDQVSWDEELCSWGGSIFDDNLGNMFANIKYKKMVIVMEPCFSGGLIRDIGQNRNNMVIMSAAAESELSYSMNSGNYDEFSYYFTCAINGADPKGKKVNADTNNDKKVSMVEAFNYARSKDTQSETPQYEDSGDGISHSGKMPASGEGTLGSKTFLKK
jgi:cytochrome b involved in lipid metabolism